MNPEKPEDNMAHRKLMEERSQMLHDEVRRQRADGPERNLRANRHARRAAEARNRRA